MAEFQTAASSRQQTEDCRIQEIETQISIAIRQGKLEVGLEYLTKPIINKLIAAGYDVFGGGTVGTKTISWA
jgi:hypothetical protein